MALVLLLGQVRHVLAMEQLLEWEQARGRAKKHSAKQSTTN
jgi:hypothetical protein